MSKDMQNEEEDIATLLRRLNKAVKGVEDPSDEFCCNPRDSITETSIVEELEELRQSQRDLSKEELEERAKEANAMRMEGNELFQNQKYAEAYEKYLGALKKLPATYLHERAVLLNNKCAAYCFFAQDQDSTQANDYPCIKDLNAAIHIHPYYSAPHLKRGRILNRCEEGHLDQALIDYRSAITLRQDEGKPCHQEFLISRQIEQKIMDRNSRLKDVWLSKLRDFGDMCLDPFGISTDDFAVKKDEKGNYKLNYEPENNPKK